MKEQAVGVKMNRAPKISWIDEKLNKFDSHSPGPKYDVQRNCCSKPIKRK